MFASTDEDEGTDDDAGQSDAHPHYDARHGPLVQVVETIRERCKCQTIIRCDYRAV